MLKAEQDMPSTSHLRTRSWVLPAIAALTVATACAKPKPPTITPKSAQVLAASASGVTLAVSLEVA
ncbi:MAG TPA: hypothetical protein VER04_08550, partial [Polyangiaceae bacterium]|nr:hypothetical protein [Polyangiaceae bacterium]